MDLTGCGIAVDTFEVCRGKNCSTRGRKPIDTQIKLIATLIPHVRNRNRIIVSFSQWLCGKVRALEDVFGWGLQVQIVKLVPSS